MSYAEGDALTPGRWEAYTLEGFNMYGIYNGMAIYVDFLLQIQIFT